MSRRVAVTGMAGISPSVTIGPTFARASPIIAMPLPVCRNGPTMMD